MNNFIIPTTVVDGFFENPDDIRNYALSLDYTESDPNYPGLRSKCLSEINPELFSYVITRFLSIYYSSEEGYEWYANAYFQKIDGNTTDGWVHQDPPAAISSIIYLNKDISRKAGTSIYSAKKEYTRVLQEGLNDYHNKKIDYEHAVELRKESNSRFDKIIEVSNVYNRLVAFDSSLWHATGKLTDNKEDRLTLVVFIKSLFVGRTPIMRMRKGGM